MFKKSIICQSVALAIALPGVALAEIEISGFLKNETAIYLKDGPSTGQTRSTDDMGEGHSSGDLLKFENSARIFMNGDLNDNTTWHADLNLIYDSEGANDDYKGHRIYSQHDWLKELYIDTTIGDWDFRIGKQQLVWGTADGIKLLDIINPTDWRELNQNAMEDSRIPIWMITGETNITESSNIQVVISQAESSKVAGMLPSNGETRTVTYNNPMGLGGFPVIPTDNSQLQSTDAGNGFIMKGVDTITGGVNGFFSIGAAMGAVTTTFRGDGTAAGSFTNPVGGTNPNNPEFATVGGFTAAPSVPGACGGASGAACLENFTEVTNRNTTNLVDADPMTGEGWDISNPNSTWEYMANATFATFNAFVGMNTKYERDHPDDLDLNYGIRFRNSLDNGLNFGINYLYAYDPNPVVNIHYEDPNTGQRLESVERQINPALPGLGGFGPTVVQVHNPVTGQYYGALTQFTPGVYLGDAAVDVTAGNSGGPAQLVFEETLERAHNLGGSLDYAFDTNFAPIVIRGEFLYQKDIHQPVVDLAALSRGNLTNALKTEEHDFFKYVIGVDVTVLTNMMVSGQFIQFRNLDFISESKTCVTQVPGVQVNCSRYTADPATMHLTNGLNKGWKNKEFYSLFFSKPFGESQEHRWNNITIYEEGDGWWNRFDVEYSFTDELIGSFEWNQYWGDENTTFGQFKESSNLQLGVKYIFE